MWLKINYQQEEFEYALFKEDAISVSLINKDIAPVEAEDKSIRLSKIFPLVQATKRSIDLNNCEILFFEYKNPYRILGKINQTASEDLKESTFFAHGVCSIILFSEKKELFDEFNKIISTPYISYEKWIVNSGLIKNIITERTKLDKPSFNKIKDYSILPIHLHALLDEFVISTKILENKVTKEDSYNIKIINELVSIVNAFTNELIYLNTLTGDIPESLTTQDFESLKNPFENQKMQHQIINRLIQINSSISYVSTQSFSGSIPILERRSLIRRSSLLGIGAAMKSINKIVDYIENAFLSVSFVEIITNRMHKAPQLGNLLQVLHNKKDWRKQNVDTFNCNGIKDDCIKKLGYFSARHAYRESEFSITASINSLTFGLSLEWSLMTITHEMLHSHVRNILTSIFYDTDQNVVKDYTNFYNKYIQKVEKEDSSNYSLIDSVREAIFTYTIRSIAYGSLTDKKKYRDDYRNPGAKIYIPKFDEFYNKFQNEYRNINEIFVHVLDMHYFYGGRTSKYISMIWCSWSAVPHVSADIRQYILRSLLAIASKIDQEPYERWRIAIDEFKTIIENCIFRFPNIPLFNQLLKILEDNDFLKKYYFTAFKNSLIVVDIAMEIFYSERINSILWNDENINITSDESGSEDEYTYNLPLNFTDAPISCPIPYLFDRMLKVLNNEIPNQDIERQTTISILALNSN